MIDLLFEQRNPLTRGDLIGYAGKLGVGVADFIDDLENHTGAPRVAEEVEGQPRQRSAHADLLRQLSHYHGANVRGLFRRY